MLVRKSAAEETSNPELYETYRRVPSVLRFLCKFGSFLVVVMHAGLLDVRLRLCADGYNEGDTATKSSPVHKKSLLSFSNYFNLRGCSLLFILLPPLYFCLTDNIGTSLQVVYLIASESG